MNRRHLLKTLAITATGALAFGTTSAIAADPPPAAPAARPGNGTRPIAVGETLHFDKNLRITFLALRKDTRCPINARCATAGDAIAVIRVKAGKNPASEHRLHLNGKPGHITVSPNDSPDDPLMFYRIDIARLSPDRIAGEKIKQSRYRLRFNIAIAVEAPWAF